MKAILLEDVNKLGYIGDIIDVKNGYFRNFLLPRKLAMKANPQNVKIIGNRKKILRRLAVKEIDKAKELAEKLESISIKVSLKAGEDGKLFGSVTAAEIADKLKDSGFEVDKKKIELPESIKRLGMYTVNIKVHPEVLAKLKVLVEKV